MITFDFHVGGYFGTSHYVYIDAKQKNKIIRYAKAPGGIYVDLKLPKNEMYLYPEILLKEIPLTDENWINFLEELAALDIQLWKDEYNNNDILDGTQWSLEIQFSGREKIKKWGSNEYPDYWKTFLKLLSKYAVEDIE